MALRQFASRHAATLFSVASALLLFVASAANDLKLFEAVHEWAHRHESWNLDGWFLAAGLPLLGFTIDAVRQSLRSWLERARLRVYAKLLDEMRVAQAHNLRGLIDVQERLAEPDVDLAALHHSLERRIKRGFLHLESMERRSELDKSFNPLLLGDFQPRVDPERFFRTQPPRPQSGLDRLDPLA